MKNALSACWGPFPAPGDRGVFLRGFYERCALPARGSDRDRGQRASPLCDQVNRLPSQELLQIPSPFNQVLSARRGPDMGKPDRDDRGTS